MAENVTVYVYYSERRRERCPALVNHKDYIRSNLPPSLSVSHKSLLSSVRFPFPSSRLCPSPLRYEPATVAEIAVRGLSCEMKDGTAAALGDDRTHPHTHFPGSLAPTCVAALSFAVEMVPAWANLHNTLLTPLLYSSITPRQLLQVRAFV